MKSHYTAQELAGLAGMPTAKKNVLAKAEREGWEYRPRSGRGGGREYSVTSLPQETRAALASRNTTVGYEPAPIVKTAAERGAQVKLQADEAEQLRREARTGSMLMFNRQPKWQQMAAKAKLAIIKAANHYITRYQLAKTAGQNSFCHEYNLDRIDVAPWVRAEIRSVHPATLRDWIKAEHEQGIIGLIDYYGNRKDQSKIETWNRTILEDGTVHAPMAECIKALLLKHPHIEAKACNEELRALLPDAIRVSDKSVKRYMDKWKAQNKQEFALATNPDDFKNRFQPAFGSRSEGINGPNQRWEIDATPADLLLVGSRHKIIGLCDVGPRRLKFYVTKTERAQDNAFAVRRALLDWGVPAHGVIVTDQGAPYKTEHFERILGDLEIDQHICNAYSGDEKPHIERGFQTLSHDLMEILPGYCGHNVSERQAIEARKSFAKRLANPDEVIEISMTAEELQAFCDRWCESYHDRAHSGLDGKSPNQVMNEWPHPIRTIADERALDMLLSEAVRPGGKLPIIGKKGIRVAGGFYIHPALGEHIGEYCRAFQEPTSLGRIVVNIMNKFGVWEFLCIAEDPDRTDISRKEVAMATRMIHNEHKKEMARHAREAKKKLKDVDVVTAVLEMREREAAEAKAKSNVSYLPKQTVPHITPGLSAAAEAAAALEKRLSAPAPASPDVVAAKAKIRAEVERSQVTNVASIQVESVRSQYKRWKKLKEALSQGEIIGEAEYQFYRNFGQSAECRAFAGMEEDLGVIAR